MAVGFPTKVDYATGDVLSAQNMNDLSGTVNLLESAQYAAGKNYLINADFGINQRNFTSATAGGTYTFDRWVMSAGGDGTVTTTPQTFTLGAAPVTGYEGTNFIQMVTAGMTNTASQGILVQRIESVRTLAGQTATLSFWAKATSGTPNIGTAVTQTFGTGGSPSAVVVTTGATQAITTSWARYSATINVPSISGKTIGTTAGTDYLSALIYVCGGSATGNPSVGVQNNTFQIWGVQLEEGVTASAFQTATGTKQGELAACQRYYYRAVADTTSQNFGAGQCFSTTVARTLVPFPVTMRTAPTALEQSGTAADYFLRNALGTGVAVSAVPVYTALTTSKLADVTITVAAGLVAGNATILFSANTNAYLGWSAEL
jgi:hypothetical protein